MDRKTVWVTGASSGLGFFTAKALADAGHLVIAGARSFAAQPGRGEDGFFRLPLDVTQPESIAAFTKAALALSPKVDALYNCAGILVLGACEDTSIDEYRSVMEANFFGMTAMIRAALPLMRSQGAGRIVNFSSINGLLGIPFQSAYTASKHAMEGYSECLAMEVAPLGIEVCLVEPGDHRGGSHAYRRHAAAAGGDSPYAEAFRRGVSVIARDEAAGLPPERLGRIAAGLLEKKRLPLRKRVAKFDQSLAVTLHALLPPGLIQFILTQYYLGKGDMAHAKEKSDSRAL